MTSSLRLGSTARLTLAMMLALLIFGGVALAQNDEVVAPAAPPARPTEAEDREAGIISLADLPAIEARADEPAAGANEACEQSAFSSDIFDFPGLDPLLLWWLAPVGAVLALVFAFIFYGQVKRANPGDENMQKIAAHVRQGAYAYLKRQYKVVAVFFAVVCAILFWMGRIGVQHQIVFVAFLTAGFFSGLCGFLGMKTATLASSRAAQGAKESLNRGLTVAFRAGAVMGLLVVGFGLLDVSMWFLILTKLAPAFGYHMSLVEVTVVMVTFGMGASSQALFARVGGGIFTKAADVGADLVGKVEAGIPEDDPRNPATIADNVGDNVGDVAGMGADLYESYCGSILATAALGVAAAYSLNVKDHAVSLLAAPMVLAGVGILLSILGIYLVRTKEGASMKQLMGALSRGVNGSSLLIALAAGAVCYGLLGGIEGVRWWGIWCSILSGLSAGIIIGKGTEYFTSYDYAPTRNVARSSETGAATVIISGLAEGMRSTWVSLLTVIVAIIAAYSFAGGFGDGGMPIGLYGVGIAAVGMLATLGITLATDAYGPIADNAGGNAEMTGQDPEVRKRTDALDSLGNTTAAMGKGFAIGSAALTALALLAAYVEEVRVGQRREGMSAVVQMVDADAEKDAHAGVGSLAYVGHGKIGAKTSAGKGESSFDCFMILAAPKGQQMTPGKIAGVLSEPDPDSKVQALAVRGADGADHTYQVVAASEATLSQYMDFYKVHLLNPKVLGGCGR